MNINSGGPHILLLERDQQLTTLLSAELGQSGYEVHTARTAVEVFDVIARFPVRLVMVNLAQAQAGRREFWSALGGRGVQVFTFRCSNLGGYGPDDPEEHIEIVPTDLEVDGRYGLVKLVDAVRARVPAPISNQPSRPAYEPIREQVVTRPTDQAYQDGGMHPGVQPAPGMMRPTYPAHEVQPAARPPEPQQQRHSTFTDKIRAVIYPPTSRPNTRVSEQPRTNQNPAAPAPQQYQQGGSYAASSGPRFAEEEHPTYTYRDEGSFQSPPHPGNGQSAYAAPNSQPYPAAVPQPYPIATSQYYPESGQPAFSPSMQQSYPAASSQQYPGGRSTQSYGEANPQQYSGHMPVAKPQQSYGEANPQQYSGHMPAAKPQQSYGEANPQQYSGHMPAAKPQQSYGEANPQQYSGHMPAAQVAQPYSETSQQSYTAGRNAQTYAETTQQSYSAAPMPAEKPAQSYGEHLQQQYGSGRPAPAYAESEQQQYSGHMPAARVQQSYAEPIQQTYTNPTPQPYAAPAQTAQPYGTVSAQAYQGGGQQQYASSASQSYPAAASAAQSIHDAPTSANSSSAYSGESSLAQLSRMLREDRPEQRTTIVNVNTQNASQTSTPAPGALSVDEQELEELRAHIMEAAREDEVYGRLSQPDTSALSSQLRASPINDTPFEHDARNRSTIQYGQTFESPQRSSSANQPAAQGENARRPQPGSLPDTPLASPISSQIREAPAFTSEEQISDTVELDEKSGMIDLSPAGIQQILARRQEVKTSDDTLLDIVKSLPPMAPPAQPPQPQVLNGRATRSLGSVLLEGHLVPGERLQVAQHVQRMLRGVDLNYQLGEILLMFKLLTPDQLLAASLVSYGMISTVQISGLGRIRQELHSMGLEYDLESLVILFRLLTPEQLREVRSTWSS